MYKWGQVRVKIFRHHTENIKLLCTLTLLARDIRVF